VHGALAVDAASVGNGTEWMHCSTAFAAVGVVGVGVGVDRDWQCSMVIAVNERNTQRDSYWQWLQHDGIGERHIAAD